MWRKKAEKQKKKTEMSTDQIQNEEAPLEFPAGGIISAVSNEAIVSATPCSETIWLLQTPAGKEAR